MLQYGSSSSSGGKNTGSALGTYVRGLGPKDSGTVRLFESKYDWRAVGADAEFIAADYYKTRAVIKYLDGDASSGIPYVAISRGMLEDTVRDLLLNRKVKVEVHGRRGSKWALVDTATAGNLKAFEETVLRGQGSTSADDPNSIASTAIVAVRVVAGSGASQTLAAAAVDVGSRTLALAEMAENDQYTNFESLLIQTGATEVLMPKNLSGPLAKRLVGIAQAAGVLVTTKPTSFFASSNVEQDTRRLTGVAPEVAIPELEGSLAPGTLAALFKYLELLDDPSTYGKYKLRPLALSDYMRLDAAAVSALHLFDTGGAAAAGSLFSLLNRCKTPQGSRKLHQWIKQPLLNIDTINRRLDLVSVFIDAVQVRAALQGHLLKAMPDLFRLASKFLKSRASLEDMVRLYQAAAKVPVIVQSLRAWHDPSGRAQLVEDAFVTPLDLVDQDLAQFVTLVETTIDLDLVAAHEYVIKRSVDPALEALATQRDSIVASIEAVHADFNARFESRAKAKPKKNSTLVKLEVNDAHGYFMRVPRSREKHLRDDASVRTLETRKDGVKFTTPELMALSSSYKSVVRDYSDKQAAMEAKVLEIGASYTTVFEDLNDIIASIDVLVALADASLCAPIPYVRPNVVPSGSAGISLQESRHPCLEALHDIQFIPNDVALGDPAGKRLLLITGPNMGGKSTYIRQIGVITLMAQIGCYVPAAAATIPVVDCILARVGAGDSQLRGVSTFMAEMLETAAILATATENSLIIIDELGRGTSTYDGYGLAYAIAEHIATKTRAQCVFATHFHELTQLEDHLPNAVANVHVTAHTTDETLTLLYKIRPGPCDRSFGIHVARLAQFPDKVINMAKRKATALEDFGSFADAAKDNDDDSVGAPPDAPPAKRRKALDASAVAAGEEAIQHFLTTARDTLGNVGDLDAAAATLAPDQKDALAAALASLRAVANPYVDNLLAKFS